MVSRVAVATLLLSTAPAAFAQGLGNRTTLDEIIVTASVATELREARRSLERIPGSIGLVEAESFLDDFAQSIGDTLVFTPGVFADTSAQRENRISIRGSGLNSGFERRGLTLLRDGVPITRASGSTEFQEVDPVSISFLEVYKGANGLAYGAASLGGAINIVSPSGRSARTPVTLRLEGGSFDTVRGNVQIAGADDKLDYHVSATGLTSSGYREHSNIRSLYGFANVGLQLSDTVETRVFVTALTDNFELAGSLSLADALANRRQAGRPVTAGPFFPGGPVTILDPGPVADDWDRNLDVVRLVSRTTVDLGALSLQAGGWYSWRGLDHAITRFAGIIDQKENEFGLFARLGNNDGPDRKPVEWLIGAQANIASNDAKTWANNSGERGTLTGQSDQDSANLTAYGQLDAGLATDLRMVAGLQYATVRREVAAILNAVSGRRVYSQLNPRLGLLYTPSESIQLFANVNRGFEPPSLADLTAGGARPFGPLDAQRAWTVEAGGRGQTGIIAFDVTVYRSWIEQEFLDFGEPGARGFVSYTANADRTIHQGIEAGLDVFVDLTGDLGAVWRQVYTLNDFRFRDDASYGDNRLAGVPRHVYTSEVRLNSKGGWYLAANLRWSPEGPWVDFANTTKAPGYALWGLNAGVDLSRNIRLFGSVENLFNTAHISNVATNANQLLERAAAYTPGQGRAIFAGLSAGF
ncbi:TonB-dependent receptor family protein [Polymorphobacter sp.]|uniref:TonB-dependent receptor family protein n=1 Tax=Polymorphobacter sp. TaxID=1909290 RepID=UPI003F70DA15